MSFSRFPRFPLVSTAIAIAASCTLGAALAADPPATDVNRTERESTAEIQSVEPTAVYAPQIATEADGADRSPLMKDIEAAFERGRTERVALEASVSVATDEETILSLQRRIEELAQETELEILGIQAAHARAAGREDLAARIEQDIAAIRNPPVPHTNVVRPAPERR